MTYNQALNKLGLSEGFSDIELTRAKRNYSKRYHPDLYIGRSKEEIEEAEAIIKDLNDAYDILKNNSASTLLEQYKTTLIKKMCLYLLDKINDDNLMAEAENILSECISLLPFKNSIKELDSIFETFLDKLKKLYKSYFKQLCQEHNINESDIEEEINYNCSVSEFYKQLITIKNKYSLLLKVQKKVQEIKDEYTLRAGFKQLEKLIDRALNDVFLNEVLNKKTPLEVALTNIKNQIEKIFITHYKIIAVFNKTREKLNSNNNLEQFIDILNSIEKSYLNGEDITSIKAKLNSLENEIKSHENILINQSILEKLYQQVIEKYYFFLQNYGFKNPELLKKAEKIFRIFLSYLEKARKGLIGISDILIFQEITFIDLEHDFNLLNNMDNIYINKKVSRIGESFITKMEINSGNTYMLSFSRLTDNVYKTMLNSLNTSNYISLDDFMTKGIFIGRIIRNTVGQAFCLYQIDDKALIMDDTGDLDLIPIVDIDSFLEKTEDLIKYQDKDFMKCYIIEYFENLYKQKKESQNQRKGQ